MSLPDDELQSWFSRLPYKVKRELAVAIKEQAEMLADEIKAAAPVKTGKLRDSVRVRRKRNDLDLEVTAGGDETTRMYGRDTDYASDVVIDGRSNRGIAKRRKGEGLGVSFDYALAVEYGTVHQEAEPFFFAMYRQRRDDIRQAIDEAVEHAISQA